MKVDNKPLITAFVSEVAVYYSNPIFSFEKGFKKN